MPGVGLRELAGLARFVGAFFMRGDFGEHTGGAGFAKHIAMSG